MKRNLSLAGLFLVLLTFWLISGCFTNDHEKVQPLAAKVKKPILKVMAKELEAQEIQKEIVISGKTIPARTVTVRSELDARVVELGVERGAIVNVGEIIAVLDERNLAERLDEAKALLQQRELEYTAAIDLFKKKFQSETKVAEAKTALESAKSNLKKAQVDLDNTRIAAPFAGIIEDRVVEIGDYLSAGDEIAKIIETDPIIFEGSLNERQVEQVYHGMHATAKTLEGQRYVGFIRYVSRESGAQSRMFTVEMEAQNRDLAIPAGVSVDITIPTEFVMAHSMSPAILSLDNKGALGVKVVDDEDKVQFVPAKIVKSTATEVWLTGLPETIRLITVGQGFAQVGDSVKVTLEESPKSSEPAQE